MLSTIRISLLALAALAAATTVDGAACTAEEAQYSYDIYLEAAQRSGCSPYAIITDSTVNIKWTCSSSSCIPTLMQLESQLPDCERDGTNLKQSFAENLYTNCNLCSFDEQETVFSLYTAAANTAACSAYSLVTSTYVSITWPCSATGCTAVIHEMAEQLPSCVESGENVKTYAQDLTCYTSDDDDDSTDTPDTPSSTEVETTTSAPTTDAPSTTETPETDSSYSTESCSASEITDMVNLYYETATGADCDTYSVVSDYYISIYAPCSSSCVSDMRDLATDLPDCYYDYDYANEKEELTEALSVCDISSRRLRELGTAATGDDTYVSFYMYSSDRIAPASASASSESSASAESFTPEPDTTVESGGDNAGSTFAKSVLASLAVVAVAVGLA